MWLTSRSTSVLSLGVRCVSTTPVAAGFRDVGTSGVFCGAEQAEAKSHDEQAKTTRLVESFFIWPEHLQSQFPTSGQAEPAVTVRDHSVRGETFVRARCPKMPA